MHKLHRVLQVMLHPFNQFQIFYLLGHSNVLQAADSCAGPKLEQSFPPRKGAGLSHFLDLVLIPPSQLLLQEPNEPHDPYPPSTRKCKI